MGMIFFCSISFFCIHVFFHYQSKPLDTYLALRHICPHSTSCKWMSQSNLLQLSIKVREQLTVVCSILGQMGPRQLFPWPNPNPDPFVRDPSVLVPICLRPTCPGAHFSCPEPICPGPNCPKTVYSAHFFKTTGFGCFFLLGTLLYLWVHWNRRLKSLILPNPILIFVIFYVISYVVRCIGLAYTAD